MSVRHIKRCPMCGYRLRGLPCPHRCPECGAPYDEHSYSWRPRWPWMIYVWTVLAATCLVPDLGSCLPAPQGRKVSLVCLVVWCAVALAGLIYWYLANQRGRIVALTPEGLLVRDGIEGTLIPWHDVGDIEVISRSKLRVIRVSTCDDVPIEHIFASEAECRDFCTRVSQAKQGLHGHTPPADKQPTTEA